MQKEKKYLLKKELATRYRVSTSTIERWVNSKVLPLPIRLGPNRILWDIEEIIEWEKCKKEERKKCQ
ncbi:AlpA family phage regulatory protein [Pelagibacteraceae bacterium]|nr:AlpA family phage regulatory protein [Pelagibacteraceae bacterium]